MLLACAFWLALAAFGWPDRAAAKGKDADEIQFGADHYSRDMTANTARGTGNAWVRRGGRTMYADQIDADFNTNRAIATGNVHIVEGDRDIWASRVDDNMKGDDAELENMTMVHGQIVITGSVVHKRDSRHFEVEEGTYTNCNVGLSKDPAVGGCALDWKLHGRRFVVNMGEYAHFYDVILYARNIPVLYLPYLVLPVKSTRQSGLLMPIFPYASNTGSGFTLPLFLALAPWQDLTLTPTFYSLAGLHLGAEYRYVYSPSTRGDINLFLLTEKFLPPYGRTWTGNPPGQPGIDTRVSDGKTFGLFGDSAVSATNRASLGGRFQTRQELHLMSSSIYAYEFPGDVYSDLSYLRSQVSFTFPWDEWLVTAQARYDQSIVISKDPANLNQLTPTYPNMPTSDNGAVAQLPSLQLSRTNSSLLGQLLSYEADIKFDNFYRPNPADLIPSGLLQSNPAVPNPANPFDQVNYYVRTGRRLQVEPRLVANIPMPSGLQLQPSLTAGSLAYQFDYPTTQFVHREYAGVEIPFSLYLSKLFTTGIDGYEKVSHVFQPRVIFASSLYQSPDPTNPFFFQQPYNGQPVPPPNTPPPEPLSNPRFDITDLVTPYQYLRFELINRFRRKTSNGVERFFLLQVSEQYNAKTNPNDPRFQKQLGPIELLSELHLGRFSAQIQAIYQLQAGGLVGNQIVDQSFNPSGLTITHEYDFSSTFSYTAPNRDQIGLGSLFSNREDPTLIQQTANLFFLKTLPTFFDVNGQIEYDLHGGQLVSYQLGLTFQAKPRSCWHLSTQFGRSGSNNLPFFNIGFSLDFGATGDVKS